MPSISKMPAKVGHPNLKMRTQACGEVRLDGWKEIAAYLGRGERTVKRWETARGLPLHRIPGEGRRRVFAYAAELDAWLLSSGGRGAAQDADRKSSSQCVELSASSAEDAGIGAEAARHSSLVSGQSSGAVLPAARSALWSHAWSSTLFYATVLAGLTLLLLRFSNPRQHEADTVSAAGERNAANVESSHNFFTPTVSNADKAAAHSLYLNGRYEWNLRTPDSLNRAVGDFTEAIVRDPNDAEAYVGLAETYALLRQFSTMPDADAFSRSLAAAQKAVELDDSLAEAHRALAFAEMYGNLDFSSAEREFRRAIELDPRDPVARRWYANAFGMPGRFDETLHQMDAAQALDPASNATLADKGWMLFLAGRPEDGIQTLREVESAAPAFASPHAYLMQIGLETRDYPLFLDEGAKTAAAKNDAALAQMFAAAGRAYASGGEAGLLEAVYAQGQRTGANGKGMATLLAKVSVRLGRNEEAMRILEEQYAQRDPDVLACISHPTFLELRGEPRYQALVKRLNVPERTADASSGDLPGMSGAPALALR